MVELALLGVLGALGSSIGVGQVQRVDCLVWEVFELPGDGIDVLHWIAKAMVFGSCGRVLLERLPADRLVLLGNELRSESALTQFFALFLLRQLLRLLQLQLMLFVQKFETLRGIAVSVVLDYFLAILVDRRLETAVLQFDCLPSLLIEFVVLLLLGERVVNVMLLVLVSLVLYYLRLESTGLHVSLIF